MGLPSPGPHHPELCLPSRVPAAPRSVEVSLPEAAELVGGYGGGGQARSWEHPEAAKEQAPGAPTVCWSLLGTVYTTLNPRGQ